MQGVFHHVFVKLDLMEWNIQFILFLYLNSNSHTSSLQLGFTIQTGGIKESKHIFSYGFNSKEKISVQLLKCS